MSQLTPRQNVALMVGGAATIVPGMIMSGFMPEWDVLPATSWLAIAAIGSAVGGVIGFPRQWLRASIAGAITGSGALIGLILYVYFRTLVIDSDTFIRIELAIGPLLGALPGGALFSRWVIKQPVST
ncbi:MAG: hypothetical protein AAGL17_05935 [Cyanobacteria bacterium J06576_12]